MKNIQEHLCRARIAISPMVSGSGMQNKILDALSVGLPVVSSKISSEPIEHAFEKSNHLITINGVEEWINF